MLSFCSSFTSVPKFKLLKIATTIPRSLLLGQVSFHTRDILVRSVFVNKGWLVLIVDMLTQIPIQVNRELAYGDGVRIVNDPARLPSRALRANVGIVLTELDRYDLRTTS